MVADLAGPVVDAEVQAPAEDEPAADPGAAHDADHVVGAARCTDTRLGEREGVAVVDEPDGKVERTRERLADRPPGPVAGEVREEDAAALGVDEPRERDADRGDRAGVPRKPGDAVEDRLGPVLRRGRLGRAVHDLVAVEDDELHVGAADVEPDPARHRAVQPPSTVSTAPVTNGAVAR